MKQNNLVSIIIPIYNSANYIENCVNSIENQTYKNIEVILVNDGSTDNSLEVCKKIKKQYNNIIIINKKNGGVSSARNSGIVKANGKYIQFVDSDDTVCKKYTELLLNSLLKEDADISMCGYNEQYQDNIKKVYYKSCSFIYKDNTFIKLFKTNKLINSPCNKLYKKEYIAEYFLENLSIGEDLLFNINYLKKSKKCFNIDDCLYNYIQRNNSATNKYNRKNYYDVIELDNYLCNYGLGNYYYNNFINNIYDLFCLICKNNLINQKEELKVILNDEYLEKRINNSQIGLLNIKNIMFIIILKSKSSLIINILKKII